MGLLQDPYNPVGTNPYVTRPDDASPSVPVMNDQVTGLLRAAGTVPAAGGGVVSGKTLSDATQAASSPSWPGSLTIYPPLGQQPQNPAGTDLSSLH